MSIIAKYKFDKSIYADLLPKFNAEFTSDLYNTTDEVDSENSNYIIRTIESDSLPTLMRFGRVWVDGEPATDNRTDSLLEVLTMNTSGLTDCHSMFRYNANLTSIDCEWDTSNVTRISNMFAYCTNLTSLDVSNFNTSKVADMSSMFYGCTNLTSLDVSNFNTSNVTDMNNMFSHCNKLTTLDVSNFDTSNVTLMSNMFYGCHKLTSLDVSNFDTSKISNLSDLFNSCYELTEIKGIDKWNINSTTNILGMFCDCYKLTSLNLSNWNTSNIVDIRWLFCQCRELSYLDISNWNLNKVTNGGIGNSFTNVNSLLDIGMLYCDQPTINKVASFLPTNITQTIWVEDVDVKDLTTVEGVEFKQYAKNTEVMLTSPLLEGDKLIVKDGKLYHWHKMGMVVLDGSEDEGWIEYTQYISTNIYKVYSPLLKDKVEKSTYNHGMSDKLPSVNIESLLQASIDVKGISITGHDASIVIGLNKSVLPSIDLNGFKQWLQANPTTVVYELASPYYELISEDPLTISLIAESSDITNSSNIPLNMTINNKGLSTIAMSPSTTYTVVFDKDTDSEVVVNLCGNEVTTTDNIVEITTPSEIDDELIFYGDGVEVSNVRLLEGSVSGDSIPRESFEGLKNSFEDGYIPENELVDFPKDIYLNGSTFNEGNGDGYDVYYHTVSFKTNTVYTVFCNINEETTCTDGVGLRFVTKVGSSQQDIIAGDLTAMKGVFCSTFTLTKELREDKNLELWNRDTGIVSISNMVILEGDWTHLTEEDWNNLGKYKVEYKVIGKNKFDGELRNWSIDPNTGGIYTGGNNYSNTNAIKIKGGQYYKFTYEGIISQDNINKADLWCCYYDHSMNFISLGASRIITPQNAKYLYFYFVNPIIKNDWYIQIEEGITPTEYEPYKEYTKTYYLSSPLLEGDTIEDVNGVATHVKRKGSKLLDGSEEGWYIWDVSSVSTLTNTITFAMPTNGKNGVNEANNTSAVFGNTICDKFIESNDIIDSEWHMTYSDIASNNRWWSICINKTKLSTPDVAGFKQWLSENPTTIIYELASPIYEPISNESILCDSYVNGHLDVDSAIPIEKVQFLDDYLRLRYIKASTRYTLQFEADNEGHLDWFTFGNIHTTNKPISKGVNKFTITTNTTINSTSPLLYLGGIGFNASNIQVVATDRDVDFGYFKGLQSSFENNIMENLWDGTLVKGMHISSESTYNENVSETRSAYIKCRPNTTYIITATNNNRLRIGHVSQLVEGAVCMVSDIDDTNISYKEFTTAHTEGYLIVYVANENNTNENITVDIREKANKVKCKVVGKNKFDKSNVVLGYWGTDSTTYHTNIPSVFSHKTPIKVKPNTWYTMQSLGVAGNVYVVGLHPFESILVVNNSRASFYTNNRTEVYIQINTENTDLSKFLDIIQLEEGTQATEYEPYQEYTKTIYLNSPLLKGDTVEVHNGKLCHYHKMGRVVLDGSEDWLYWSTNTFILGKYNANAGHKNVISDYLPTTEYGTYRYGVSYGNGYIAINNGLNQTDVGNFKQWLQANPTTVVYELAEPYYEEITPTQEDLIITSVKEGDLHIDTIVPISSKVTYNVNVQLLTDFEQSIVEQVQATQTTDLQSILDEEIDN